ncbi:hypothetical protein HHK36_015166 [Tetracentron sinense]|uniref:Uncharacterized protein n=1 Tax=Tetracentron sinense TaxID=13715 RepID=A0A835DDL4_TETSI|nr:hypothetical protein HHK36_015166 [Tetracentron sinense]
MAFIMAQIKALLTAPFHHFIHKDFHGVVARMTLIDSFLFLIVHSIDKLGIWHRLPVILGMIYLAIRRHLHQQYNLLNVGGTPIGVRYNPVDYPYRTANGRYNDPFNEGTGSQGTFFGRNMHPVNQKDKLMKPDPMVVATKLLARRNFTDTGKQFNMIAASWIQFMIHDWVDHLESTNQIELTAPSEVASKCPLKSFKFYQTKEVPTGFYDIKSGALNTRTPWWDGSAIYGSNNEKLSKVRTFKDGKLKISEEGLLLHDQDGVAVSGDVRNSWAGVSTLQALFVKEHNAVCDTLKKEYPDLDDEDLYRHARLVTSAVIAKVHTIDWTVELLKTDTLLGGMRGNWYGLLGKKFKDTFGHVGGSILGGLVGLKKPDNHGVPYSLTEEFVSVYRMHSLLPDHLLLRDDSAAPGTNKSPPLIEKVPMANLIGLEGEKTLSDIGFTKQMVSMGHQASGALELWNYPMWFRDLIAQDKEGRDRPDHVDMPALEVYRDRERGVARYNEFRRSLLLIPISKWEDLTSDEEAIQALREVYGDDVEELDILVGLMAEEKITGFAISETAFIIFLLMASRRLEADRFFTSYFNEETYTKKGLEWVNKTESLRDVLIRHYPEMTEKWMNSTSAFSVWDSPPNSYNPIPLYLRIPKSCTPLISWGYGIDYPSSWERFIWPSDGIFTNNTTYLMWVALLSVFGLTQLIIPIEPPMDGITIPSMKVLVARELSLAGTFPLSTRKIRDGSAIYGSNNQKLSKVKTFKDGKLKISEEGLLLHDQDGIAMSGDVRNSWAGLSTLQALFIKEHNAVCDTLKKEYPELEDEDLYRHGRLVTSAVIAKIHTIDWTVELLKTDTLLAAMRINWYGLLGKKFKDAFGHVGGSILGGMVGLKKPDNHGVPFSLTEEFVSAYRLHSLLPDHLLLRDVSAVPGANKSPPLIEKVPMAKLTGLEGEKVLSEIGFTKQMVSMGHQASGALELWNYPMWLRDVIAQDKEGRDRPDHVDMPALEVYRDRERGVARYNEFRRSLLLIPISKWEDLTSDEEAIEALREVYGDDVEELDLLVGFMAEEKIKGFAISETAFVIFILMASRRLEADRFFTSYFNEETYTKKGLEWVNKTESLRDVLKRHYPEMTEKWMNSTSAFSVWDSPPNSYNPIPLYLRIPK